MATAEKPTAAGGKPGVPQWVVVLLENLTYPRDTRVRNEAESLVGAGHSVTVLAPRGRGEPSRELVRGVEVRRYRTVWAGRSPWSYALEYGVAHVQLTARSLVALLRGADTLHLNGPPDTLAVAGLLARLGGAGWSTTCTTPGPSCSAPSSAMPGSAHCSPGRCSPRSAPRCGAPTRWWSPTRPSVPWPSRAEGARRRT